MLCGLIKLVALGLRDWIWKAFPPHSSLLTLGEQRRIKRISYSLPLTLRKRKGGEGGRCLNHR